MTRAEKQVEFQKMRSQGVKNLTHKGMTLSEARKYWAKEVLGLIPDPQHPQDDEWMVAGQTVLSMTR